MFPIVVRYCRFWHTSAWFVMMPLRASMSAPPISGPPLASAGCRHQATSWIVTLSA
jgi:hypothetical protein